MSDKNRGKDQRLPQQILSPAPRHAFQLLPMNGDMITLIRLKSKGFFQVLTGKTGEIYFKPVYADSTPSAEDLSLAELLNYAQNGEISMDISANYEEIDPTWLICTKCSCTGNFRRRGGYPRKNYMPIQGNMDSGDFAVPRFQCKCCGATHGILIAPMTPYRSFSVGAILAAVRYYYEREAMIAGSDVEIVEIEPASADEAVESNTVSDVEDASIGTGSEAAGQAQGVEPDTEHTKDTPAARPIEADAMKAVDARISGLEKIKREYVEAKNTPVEPDEDTQKGTNGRKRKNSKGKKQKQKQKPMRLTRDNISAWIGIAPITLDRWVGLFENWKLLDLGRGIDHLVTSLEYIKSIAPDIKQFIWFSYMIRREKTKVFFQNHANPKNTIY